jgi:hypothetical protein
MAGRVPALGGSNVEPLLALQRAGDPATTSPPAREGGMPSWPWSSWPPTASSCCPGGRRRQHHQ